MKVHGRRTDHGLIWGPRLPSWPVPGRCWLTDLSPFGDATPLGTQEVT